jgi:hypothetical protein
MLPKGRNWVCTHIVHGYLPSAWLRAALDEGRNKESISLKSGWSYVSLSQSFFITATEIPGEAIFEF